MRALLGALLAALLLLACAAHDSDNGETLFQQALRARAAAGSNYAAQTGVVALLLAAAGVAPAAKPSATASPPSPGDWLHEHHVSAQIANSSHTGALRELGKAFQHGLGASPDQALSTRFYAAAAALGDPTSQSLLASRLSFGLADPSAFSGASLEQFGAPDEGAALTHYYFAAAAGDAAARMALGYRHLHGIGVPASCWTAVHYYQPVAEQVVAHSTQPRGLPLLERLRLNVLAASPAGGSRVGAGREMLQYYQYSADYGDVAAQAAVGQVLNYGAHGLAQDHEAAFRYLSWAAAAGDEAAMGQLGHMHAGGQGTPVDLAQARAWFERGAAAGSASATFGLGYMHFSGVGAPQDFTLAYKHLMAAAEGGLPDAFFYLGVMHARGLGVRRRNAARAFSYFSLAASAGHLPAMYNAAAMHAAGRGTGRACRPAAALFKAIAERGRAAAPLQRGHAHFFAGRYPQALLEYLRAADMGIELGQANAAWVLESGYAAAGAGAAAAAFQLHRRSAQQGNVQSLLQMGDAFFYGSGVPQDWRRAAALYSEAYGERSAEAMFNLGFMHEFGAGVPGDTLLARRFYDMAAHTSKDAALAVALARGWLAAHEALLAAAAWLPGRLAAGLRRALTLQPPATNLLGLTGFLAHLAPRGLPLWSESMRWQAKRLWEAAAGQWDELGAAGSDMAETGTLLLLLVVLLVVFKLKRVRATRQPAG